MNRTDMIREQILTIEVSKYYAKPYVQKLKSIVWNQFDSTCEVENCSFDTDETMTIKLYFLSTDEQYERLIAILENRFSSKSCKKID
ncbi:hypothetical protein [Enterococcus thailandicus]|uniref:Uncharacterized protein n=1 Tax=Enterococcus thailandicus TaxID=417368 RepID=A0A179EVP7_ENTTH|nr:hypothetical protein [Enterococcus thailandicus]OAQ57060.1 hypothetical protein A6E74_01405 [Enterococcus thailandicus]